MITAPAKLSQRGIFLWPWFGEIGVRERPSWNELKRPTPLYLVGRVSRTNVIRMYIQLFVEACKVVWCRLRPRLL